MKCVFLVLFSALGLSVFAGAAVADHNHLTVDIPSGGTGDHIVIRAGYYADESAFTIADGRLQFNSDIAVYDVIDQLSQPGPLGGWHAGDELLLTSDFYFATGRLDGGNFRYELAGVTPVSGGPGVIAWGDFEATGFVPLAMSNADTRLGRSFDTAIAGHDHEQGYAISGGWVLDVTLVAWDSNGVYADSQPVSIRFDTGECPADFNREGGVTVQDVFDFLAAYFTSDPSADFNHSGAVTVQDIFDFLTGYFAGCE